MPGLKKSYTDYYIHCLFSIINGLLAQLAERGADNAKVVSSILTQTKAFILMQVQTSNQQITTMGMKLQYMH